MFSAFLVLCPRREQALWKSHDNNIHASLREIYIFQTSLAFIKFDHHNSSTTHGVRVRGSWWSSPPPSFTFEGNMFGSWPRHVSTILVTKILSVMEATVTQGSSCQTIPHNMSSPPPPAHSLGHMSLDVIRHTWSAYHLGHHLNPLDGVESIKTLFSRGLNEGGKYDMKMGLENGGNSPRFSDTEAASDD